MVERTAREQMLAGAPYRADDPELVAMAGRARQLMDEYNAPGATDVRNAALLHELLGTVGNDVVIRPPFYVDYGSHLHVGDRVFANYGLTALDCAEITIGDDTQIGPHVQLLTPTHPLDPDRRREKWEAAEPITLGTNVWVGGAVVILAGITIGDNAVVGAGAVVTRDVPPRSVVAGSPARVIRAP